MPAALQALDAHGWDTAAMLTMEGRGWLGGAKKVTRAMCEVCSFPVGSGEWRATGTVYLTSEKNLAVGGVHIPIVIEGNTLEMVLDGKRTMPFEAVLTGLQRIAEAG